MGATPSSGRHPSYDLLLRYPSHPGKGLRPTLFLATCEAFGGSAASAMGVAVAIELLHNALLAQQHAKLPPWERRGWCPSSRH